MAKGAFSRGGIWNTMAEQMTMRIGSPEYINTLATRRRDERVLKKMQKKLKKELDF